jgi:hypothetical protein
MLVKAGDALQLVIEHAQRSALTCGVEVVNVRSPRLGAKIVSINPENRERLAQILEDRVQAHFSRQ